MRPTGHWSGVEGRLKGLNASFTGARLRVMTSDYQSHDSPGWLERSVGEGPEVLCYETGEAAAEK